MEKNKVANLRKRRMLLIKLTDATCFPRVNIIDRKKNKNTWQIWRKRENKLGNCCPSKRRLICLFFRQVFSAKHRTFKKQNNFLKTDLVNPRNLCFWVKPGIIGTNRHTHYFAYSRRELFILELFPFSSFSSSDASNQFLSLIFPCWRQLCLD